MQITTRTDLALRLLILLAATDEPTTVRNAAARLRVSADHLFKVARDLGNGGYLEVVRGRGGGVSMSTSPRDISIGAVFRELEPDRLVECFGDHDRCVFSGACELTHSLRRAFEAFCRELDQTTLEDLVADKRRLLRRIGGR